LANSIEWWWGAKPPWVFETLIYEGVTKRWKTDLNQPRYAYTTFPHSQPIYVPLSNSVAKNKIIIIKIKLFASVPRPLPSLVTPMATVRNKTWALYLIFYASDYKLLNGI